MDFYKEELSNERDYKMKLSHFKQKVKDGRPFNVIFVKRTTGTRRNMTCKLGVTKGVKGTGMAYDPTKKDLLPVFDLDKKDFRMINLDTLLEAEVDGKKFKFNSKTREFTEVKSKRKTA